MKVIATKQGYLGRLRNPGDRFDAPDGAKASWFEPAPEPAAEKGGGEEGGDKPPKKPTKEPAAEKGGGDKV